MIVATLPRWPGYPHVDAAPITRYARDSVSPRGSAERHFFATEYVRELDVGIDDSGIRAGVLQLSPLTRIGITSLEEVAPVDIDGIRVTTQAQRQTGVGLSAEPPPSASRDISRAEIGLEILERLLDEGVSPERIVITTLDGNISDLSDRSRAIRRIADTGAFVQLGLWGAEQFQPTIPGDGLRMQLIAELIEDGYAAHILFGHDIASKMRLRSYGGRGHAHIVRNVRPSCHVFTTLMSGRGRRLSEHIAGPTDDDWSARPTSTATQLQPNAT